MGSLDNRILITYGTGGSMGIRTTLFDSAGSEVSPATAAQLDALNAAIPSSFDYTDLTHNGSDQLTKVVFRDGGSSGTVVGVIDLTYDGDNLDTVTYSDSL